jgi:threonine/homoserine/homoserine lactone efflux protein
MICEHLYLTFVLATTALMLMPGPNVALITANSVAYGTRFGLLTVAGTSMAMIVQLSFTALGMTALLGSMAQWFEWLRWIGVLYLVYLGLIHWLAPATPTQTKPQTKSVHVIFTRGFLVSMTNPKTLLFYNAFFPQFITPGPGAGVQVFRLCATFLFLALLIDGMWALLAGYARGFLGARGKLLNRLTGSLLIAAGLGLALARKR